MDNFAQGRLEISLNIDWEWVGRGKDKQAEDFQGSVTILYDTIINGGCMSLHTCPKPQNIQE